ncbi:YjeF N-terminal domain-containing protein [Naematelia encephala]|uniref:NAD(P)H-hydrate epimerase n=1 Tax=Naematelia encephala TaxID=71784 RepID=A0A1Y2AYU3_9TREE|nr:YjeF N-terminal domain-containing protein [Naematelia encephala]
MSPSGAFSLDQLMELAGLACAQALSKTFPLPAHKRVMVCCGPGNQGGDGLVAARHLHMFKYKPTIYLPKPGSKDIYQRLLRQCENLKIPVLRDTTEFESGLKQHDVILDAIFGFSFKPPLRSPFDKIIHSLRSSNLPILSIDIPSGWDVELGPQRLETQPDSEGKTSVVDTFDPEALISLTVPKMGVREYKGRHWLGGRFVSEELDEKFQLNLPDYEGTEQVVELPQGGQ